MMLFKLSFKNMKKSIKDYAIYFLTLVLGVAIFYMFNSLDSQQAMLTVSNSQRQIITLMIEMLSYVSVFVAIILGILIVYANSFLVNRRKKEFGVYMTLGMGRRQISKIILLETVFVGIISLIIGIIVGVFASQFMSVLVAKLFEADMSEFQFTFSKDSCIKTCIYFAIMYGLVMLFNTMSVSRYKLINLLNATKKNEKIKIKNPFLSVLIFIIGTVILGYAYWTVTANSSTLDKAEKLLPPIIMGIVSTILIFWSLSGFILSFIQKIKSIYYKGTNFFVLRQINNKINTTVLSMSIICLMLFMTISILSSSLALRTQMQRDLTEMTPVDLNLYKSANLPDFYTNKKGEKVYYPREKIEDSKLPISQTLQNNGLDMKCLKDIVEIPIYTTEEWKWKDSLGDKFKEIELEFSMIKYETAEELIYVSDYNKIAKLYGLTEYSLADDEFMVLCDFDSMKVIRDRALENAKIKINGKTYHSKYDKCQSGFIFMSTSHTNTGIILVPDNFDLKEEWKESHLLVANYQANSEEQYEKIEELFSSSDSGFIQNLSNSGIKIDGQTKISIIQSSVGVATIVVFIAIYLGIIFLIASSAILALKQLTESSDNRQRYTILRKIGCDEKMINKALFKQIGIFFGLPLILAIIHSIFGIQFVLKLLATFANAEDLIPSIIATIIIMGGIYGAYFIATYLGSKSIIKEER